MALAAHGAAPQAMRRIYLIGLISVIGMKAQQVFPEWRGSNVLPVGVWNASSIAAVGEVVNIRAYGEQDVESLPWPVSPEVHRLYWCEEDFKAIAVVKGELPAGIYWRQASRSAGCGMRMLD
jgi:hypothetical protein